MKKRILYLFGLLNLFLLGCTLGYQEIDGQWHYITWDEGNGKKTKPLEVDNASFEIIQQGTYAKDKYKVFYRGTTIAACAPNTFKQITGTSYIKDKNTVYYKSIPVCKADPKTFKVLDFPYAKDKHTAFCGTVPLRVKNIDSFRVLKKSLGTTTGSRKYLIRQHPELAYLDSLCSAGLVVTSLGAYAQTDDQYFKDYLEIEEPIVLEQDTLNTQ